MSKIYLEIVTPDKAFFSGDVDGVIVRGVSGDLAILKDRTPIATPLKTNKVRIIKEGEEKIAAAVDGYITVLNNEVTIVTEAAEWIDEIDVERARNAKRRAEERLEQSREEGSKIDIERAKKALMRAENRLNLVE